MSINVEFDNSEIKKLVNEKIDRTKNYLLEKYDLYKSEINIDNKESSISETPDYVPAFLSF